MKNEIELDGIITDYLNGKLTAEENTAFEQLRANDAFIDNKVVSHKAFATAIKYYADVVLLKDKMNHAHQQIDVATLSNQFKPHPSLLVNMWRNNKSAIAIAASFLILAMVSVYSINNNNKLEGSFQATSRELTQIKRSQNSLIRNINNKAQNTNVKPARFGGTGFAIAANGYILTNYHVINGADSVYVQNSKGVSFRVKAIYTDSENDIAILKINDLTFDNLGTLPYSIKKNNTVVGEAVYTLGFPKDDIVLGDGYVSSKTGLNGDTLAYQISIPVNPGNSGGPLLDNYGNIVGIINGKENKTDGAAFAIKSKYILEALNAIPQDSLSRKIVYGKKSMLQGLKRSKQVEKIQDYVFMVKVYN